MAETPADFGKVVLFRQGAPGGLTYRIPALLYLPSESAFLAFAEALFTQGRRCHVPGDAERAKARDVCPVESAGISEDGHIAGAPHHEPLPAVREEQQHRFPFLYLCPDCSNRAATAQKRKNAARLCYVSSRDGGRTWSQTTDLTEKAITDNLRKWATFAVGPGHGLQLSSGRLVVPAYAYYIHRRCFGHPLSSWTKPHAFMFYSDDGGRNWTQGRLLRALRTTECQVAELTGQDNSPMLYCNARSPDRSRAEAFSADHGEFFEKSFLSEGLSEPPRGCQGSVVSFSPMAELGTNSSSASYESKKQWLIFSHPTNKRRRLDLGIYLNMSPFEKDSWKDPWVLNKGPSAYSDLAVCKERKSLLFGCLFECGTANPYEEIAFKLFTDAELLSKGPF